MSKLKELLLPNAATASSMKPAQAAAATSCSSNSRPDDEEISFDVVFHTRVLGLGILRHSTGETLIIFCSNDKFKNTIIPGDALISASDIGLLKHKSFQDITNFFMSSKRPLTIRFKRGQPIHRGLVARKGQPSSLIGVVTTGRKISNPKPPPIVTTENKVQFRTCFSCS